MVTSTFGRELNHGARWREILGNSRDILDGKGRRPKDQFSEGVLMLCKETVVLVRGASVLFWWLMRPVVRGGHTERGTSV